MERTYDLYLGAVATMVDYPDYEGIRTQLLAIYAV